MGVCSALVKVLQLAAVAMIGLAVVLHVGSNNSSSEPAGGDGTSTLPAATAASRSSAEDAPAAEPLLPPVPVALATANSTHWGTVPTVRGATNCTGIPRRNLPRGGQPNHSELYPCYLDPDTYMPVVSLDTFPLYAKARGMWILPKPGDVLYIPTENWHWVVSGPEETLTVNTWIASREHREFRVPTVLEGLGRDWPAMDKWDTDWLASIYDEHIDASQSNLACVSRGVHHRIDDLFKGLDWVTSYDNFADYLDGFRDDTGKFTACLAMMRFKVDSPIITGGDIHHPLPDDSERNMPFVVMWHSRGLVETGIHYDHSSNSNLLIMGTKRFLLFPPGDSFYLSQNKRLDPQWDLTTPEGRAARLRAPNVPPGGPAPGEDHSAEPLVRKKRKRAATRSRSAAQEEDDD